MSKYSYEFKKKVVMAYINAEGGKKVLANKYGVKSTRDIMKWVNAYKNFGDEALLSSRKKHTYNFEFKLSVVELYLTTEVSYQELALKVGINNPPLISKWVNAYRIAGPDALREKTKGRKTTMAKPKNMDSNDGKTEYIKQIENDLLILKIENAYLKELRRLRLEQEALNKKRELSVASEESSN